MAGRIYQWPNSAYKFAAGAGLGGFANALKSQATLAAGSLSSTM